MVKLWHRIICMPDERLPKRIFMWEKALNKNNWYTDLEDVLVKAGKHEILSSNHPEAIDIKLFAQSIDETLTDIYRKEWENNIDKAPKLRTYVLCKQEYRAENYLMSNLTRQQRSLLAQLRCGILP
jgi:heme oxygenase